MANSDDIIEQLRGNGFLATFDGEERPQIDGSVHEYLTDTSFATGIRQYMRDPTASVCVLAFEIGEASPLSIKFAAELLKALAPADRLLKKHVRPLVRTSATTLHAIYRAEHHHVRLFDATLPGEPLLYQHGIRFADAIQYSAPAQLRAECADAHVVIDGDCAWNEERSPLTVKRETLPAWDSDAVSATVRALVSRFVAAGELRVCEPYCPPARDYSPEAMLARQGVRQVYTDHDVIPPIQYADERLQKARDNASMTHRAGFWLTEDGTPDTRGGGEQCSTGWGRQRG